MPQRGTPESKTWLDDALERHHRRLTLYARQILRDEERARDVVQDTFLELCSRERPDTEARLRAWLFTVCRNRALDVLRKDKRMTLTEVTDGLPDAARDEAARAEERDDVAAVLGHVDRLPSPQREIVRLKFQQGLSYREIAEVTGKSVSNVGFLIHEAVKTLKVRLAASPMPMRRTS